MKNMDMKTFLNYIYFSGGHGWLGRGGVQKLNPDVISYHHAIYPELLVFARGTLHTLRATFSAFFAIKLSQTAKASCMAHVIQL